VGAAERDSAWRSQSERTAARPRPDGPRIVLIHSPLTGPSFFAGVRDALWQRGRRAYLARLPAAEHIHPPYWLTHAAGVANALPLEGDVVLVGHSGAGPLLPAIGKLARNRGCEARVSGYLFVDCDLPRDGASRLDLFDEPAAAAALRARVERGWMRPWDAADLAGLITDVTLRERFVAELPRTPLALYDEPIRVPDQWPEAPCGYLQFSDACPTAVSLAHARGWTFELVPGHHLWPLCDPQAVAEAIDTMVGRLG
jgi:hypothetical protein